MNFKPLSKIVPVPQMATAESNYHFGSKGPLTLSIIGLGDVGGTLAQALCTLGSHQISKIQLFDRDIARKTRYAMELAQIYGPYHLPIAIEAIDEATIFNADCIVFTASVSVPPVGSGVQDVRMSQFHSNAQILRSLVKDSVAANYQGMFLIVSDPVDLLCQVTRDALNHYGSSGSNDFRVKGFGLGVMNARARYYGNLMGYEEYETEGRVYGPHGKDLIVVNSILNAFDATRSKTLTDRVVTANLEIRALGFKPYIAPAISSAAFSIKAFLEGEWHYSTIPFQGQYFGCLNAYNNGAYLMEALPDHPVILQWIKTTQAAMEADYETLPAL